MEKAEFISRYGKQAYAAALEANKLYKRRVRGYKGDNRGSWDRGVREALLGLPKKRAVLLDRQEEDL